MEEIINQAETFYTLLNEFVSQGTIPLMDAAYPQHDGNQDAEVAAEMMQLRRVLSGIATGCEMAIDHLNSAIGDNIL